jgi:hypothetical protein
MIYFFGDLRQLRKFELARPTISRPMPLPISSPLPFRSTHSRGQSQTLYIPSRSAPLPEKSIGSVSPTSSPLDSPISFSTPSRPYAQFSNASLARTSCESCESVVCPSVGCNEIDVSPAFFDDVPAPEGPATASCLHRPEYRLSPSSLTYLEPAHTSTRPEPRSGRLTIRPPATGNAVMVDPSHNLNTRSPWSSMKTEYGPTAGFIPHVYNNNSTASLSDTTRSLRSQRSVCYFDFDALPPNRIGQRRDSTGGGDSASLRAGVPAAAAVVMEPSTLHSSLPASSSSPPTLAGVGHFFGRTQYKCNQRTSAAFTSSLPDKGTPPTKRFSFATLIPSFTAGVPAFAAPLTQVQSPVVKRAQWEVVIRAGFLAALFAGGLTGIVVGVVP